MRALGLVGFTFALIDAFLAGADIGGAPLRRERKVLEKLCDEWPHRMASPAAGAWLDSVYGDELEKLDDFAGLLIAEVQGGVH